MNLNDLPIINGKRVLNKEYVEEELKKEAKAFASGKKNTGFCLRGLCRQDVHEIDMSELSIEMFKRLTFDTKTTFSEAQVEKFHPFDIIKQGKQFGNIKKSKIDGNETTIAIIDRFSDISKKQFGGRTITVYRVSKDGVEEVQSNEEGIYLKDASKKEDGLEKGYHGNTIASLTVGKECGVAPKSNVVLFHIDGIGNQEAQDFVLKFIDENSEKEGFTIPDIISVSAKTDINEHTLNELEKLGCAFINSDIFMMDFTWGRSNDGNENDGNENDGNENDGNKLVRDEVIQYTIDAFAADRGIDINEKFSGNMLIPVTGRTSSYINDDGEEVYKYNGSFCGNSFAIGQVAGLFLNARQVDKSISYGNFIKIARNTAKTNNEDMKYLDVNEFIEKLKDKTHGDGDGSEEGHGNISEEEHRNSPVKESENNSNDLTKKHSLDEFHDVAIHDRIEATNQVTRETTNGVKTENELEQEHESEKIE